MHMPRTFYEEFAARWPTLFRALKKYFEAGHVLPDDDDPTLQFEKNPVLVQAMHRELRHFLGREPDKRRDNRVLMDMMAASSTLLKFLQSHKRIFFIQPNLVQRLAHTTLDIGMDELRAPFPFSMLVFDDPISRAALDREWTTSGPISVLVHDYPAKQSLSIAILTPRRLGTVKRNFPLDKGVRIIGMRGENHQFLEIVLNALDYIEEPWDEAALVEVKKPSATDSKKASQLPYINVGSRYLPLDTPPLGTASGHKLGVRVFVKGHGRNQRHGHRNSLIKRIRIEPYWKGPEDGQVAERPYAVH